MSLDMFGSMIATPSSSPVGLAIILRRPCCNCGDERATIGNSAGPHAARLNCCGCGDHRGWLSAATFKFLCDVIDNFGRPIEIGQNQSTRERGYPSSNSNSTER
jgi:hypothetical protein